MFPVDELTKGTSKEFKAALIILAGVWVASRVIHTISQHKLTKIQTEVAKKQLKEYELKGL